MSFVGKLMGVRVLLCYYGLAFFFSSNPVLQAGEKSSSVLLLCMHFTWLRHSFWMFPDPFSTSSQKLSSDLTFSEGTGSSWVCQGEQREPGWLRSHRDSGAKSQALEPSLELWSFMGLPQFTALRVHLSWCHILKLGPKCCFLPEFGCEMVSDTSSGLGEGTGICPFRATTFGCSKHTFFSRLSTPQKYLQF